MEKPAKVVLLVLMGMLIFAWAIIIWVASVVSQTMLDTLTLIVDLAQLS